MIAAIKRHWPLLPVLLLATLIIVRIGLVRAGIGAYSDCADCYDRAVLSSDAWLLATVAILLFLSGRQPGARPWRLFQRICQLAAGLILLLYIADLFVTKQFGLRLFFLDLKIFGLEFSAVWDQYAGLIGNAWLAGLSIASLAGALIGLVFLRRNDGKITRGLLAGTAVGGLLLGLMPWEPEYVNQWTYTNYLQANHLSSESVAYSGPAADRWQQQIAASRTPDCAPGDHERRNVVVLILESWSMMHSRLFSGIHDWTPGLDRVAQQHTRYEQFHAGGFSTSEGLVYLLGGVQLWAPFKHLMDAAAYDEAWHIGDSLPQVFKQHGYTTAFLTTGPLGFLNKGDWLASLGFGYIEGNQHPFYDSFPKISFHAASDEALYQRAGQWIAEKKSAERSDPYLLVLETVSTHQPYVDPVSRERSMEKAFRYMDQTAAAFYDQLQRNGFFENGILLIVSDHRVMSPVIAAEHQRFGREARSLVPMILVDPRRPAGEVVGQTLHQGDLRPSFSRWLGAEHCFLGLESDIFSRTDPRANCALHAVGSERGRVDVNCPAGHGSVKLDGDSTRFVDQTDLSSQQQQDILMHIAEQRLLGLSRKASDHDAKSQ